MLCFHIYFQGSNNVLILILYIHTVEILSLGSKVVLSQISSDEVLFSVFELDGNHIHRYGTDEIDPIV